MATVASEAAEAVAAEQALDSTSRLFGEWTEEPPAQSSFKW